MYCVGRAYVCEFAYLADLHISTRKSAYTPLAVSVKMQLRSDGVRDLRLSDLREIYAHRYDGATQRYDGVSGDTPSYLF